MVVKPAILPQHHKVLMTDHKWLISLSAYGTLTMKLPPRHCKTFNTSRYGTHPQPLRGVLCIVLVTNTRAGPPCRIEFCSTDNIYNWNTIST